MKKSDYLIIAVIGIAIVGCNGGNSSASNSNVPQSAVQKQVFVSQSNQILTPVSASTNFSLAGANANANVKAQKSSLNATNSCLQLVQQEPSGQNYSTAFGGSQYWSTASITFGLQNICDTPQGFTANVILNNALINGSEITSTSSSVSQSGPLYMNTSVAGGSSPVITITTPSYPNSASWAQLAPGAIQTFTVQTAYSSLINSLTVSSVSIAGAPAPTPVVPGSLQLTVDASQIAAACGSSNCNNLQVNLISPSSVIVASESVNPAVNPVVQYNVQNLAPGQYSVTVNNVPTLPNGTINYAYQPSSTVAVAAGNLSYESVVFSYTPTAVNNSVALNLAAIVGPNNSRFESSVILGRIINNTNNVVSTFQLNLGSSQTISSQALPNGTYTLEVQGVGDAASGIYYAPIIQPLVISSANTSVNLKYGNQLSPSQLSEVSFSVNNAINGQTIAFGSDYKYYVYNVDNLVSGTYLFPESDSVHVNVSSISGYTTATNPTPLVISSTGPASATVTNTAVAGNNLMVGYLSNSYGIGSSIYTTVSQAAQAGYNTVVVAFAQLDNNAPLQFYGDQFLAYTSWQTFSACPAAISSMTNDIANAKKAYGLKYALASVGGATNLLTLTPGVANPQLIAQNVVSFLNTYGLDGIDFDVEEQIDPTLFAQVLAAIKQLNPNVIITAAPQSNGTGNNNALLVTTALQNNYNQAISQGLFNYIWLQGYNTGGYTLSYASQQCDETMACFIPAALGFYTSPLAVQAQGNLGVQVPSNTYFVVGEPATAVAAGLATVWHNSSYANDQAVYSALAQNYTTAMSMPQNGGAMTWSINQDIDGGCGFANSVAPVVSGISQSQIVCPTNGTTYHGTTNPNNC